MRFRCSSTRSATALTLLVLLAAGAGCDCEGARTGQATTGVTMLEPAGAPDEFERKLEFGAVRVATLASRKIVLRNDGRTNATILAARLTGDSSEFFLAGAEPLPTLEAKQTWEIELRYMPSAVGDDAAKVEIETDSPDTPKYTLLVSGKGVTSRVDACTLAADGSEVCASTQPEGRLVVEIGAAKPEETKRKPLILRNRGDAVMTVTRIAPTDLTTSEFTLAPGNGPLDVQPGGKSDFEVVYAPVDGGLDEGMIEILSDDPDSPRFLVYLKAEGLAPRICVKPSTSIDFGDQALGAVARKTVTLESCGSEPVKVNALSVGNDVREVFAVPAMPATPKELAPGETLDLEVTYSPTAFAEDSGAIIVRSTDPGASLGRISLRGRGVGCNIQVVPSTVSFGLVTTTGRTSRTVQIRNSGTGDCTVSEIRPPAAPFAVDNLPVLPLVLPAGQVATFGASFSPTANGTATGEVVLATNDARGEIKVPLTGQGRPAPPCDLQASPTSLIFTGVATGQTASKDVVLTNYGTDECNVKGEVVSGSSPAFQASVGGGFMPSTVDAGQTLRVPVKFAPTTAGEHHGTLRITYSDEPLLPFGGGSAQRLDVALQGGTLQPALCVTPEALDFGQVAAGTVADQTFTITSCGAGALGIRGINMYTGTSPEFSFQTRPRVPQFLAASQQLQVKVLYKPRTGGADFGAVELLTNDPDPAKARFLVRLKANAGTVCDRQLSCALEKLEFPTMEIGRAASLSVVCQNVGTQPVTVTGTEFAPATSTDFKARIGRTPQLVQPMGTVRLEVTYQPQDAGTDSGAVYVKADTCQQVRIDLLGVGKQPHYPPCPPPQVFQPVTKWEWTGGRTMSDSKNVAMSPAVVNLTDDNADGRIDEGDVPDVMFTSCRTGECCINCMAVGGPDAMKMMDVSGKGMLRAISGKDGSELWNVTDPNLMLTGDTGIAVGDLDGDNLPDIVTVAHSFVPGSGDTGMEGKYASGTLLAFDNRGQLKWESELWVGNKDDIELGSAPTMGDLDGDGAPEVAFQGTVFKSNGQKLFDLATGSAAGGHGSFPTLSDLDGNGTLEILTGKYAYKTDGSLLWKSPQGEGLTMILDVEKDGTPEVILRDQATRMAVLDSRTGAVKYGPWSWQVPEGVCSASMAGADVDGDGKPEFIVPTGDRIRVFKHNGQQLWEAEIVDHGGQCGAAGAAAFDFEGDGKYDVVYHDTSHIFVFRGPTGEKIFDAPRNSSTLYETPVIVDVDNDAHADIIITNENGILGIGQVAGIRVLSNQGNNWPATRRIWNEHAYHQSNVNDNGTIPRVENPNWKGDNTWRAQPPLCSR